MLKNGAVVNEERMQASRKNRMAAERGEAVYFKFTAQISTAIPIRIR